MDAETEKIIENLFNEIAKSLKLLMRVTIVKRDLKFYELYKKDFIISFTASQVAGERILIASNAFKRYSTYKKEELLIKAKNELIVKIKKQMDEEYKDKSGIDKHNIENMFMDLADALNLEYGKHVKLFSDLYNKNDSQVSYRFSLYIILNSDETKFKIRVLNEEDNTKIDTKEYTKKELDLARKELIVKIKKKMDAIARKYAG